MIYGHNEDYFNLLKIMTSLSGLFSDNEVPYLYYRNAENLFCYALNAKNLSRDDTAFDALLECHHEKIGVGLKTFICTSQQSMEKVAEFNQLAHSQFQHLTGDDLVRQVAQARNERIQFAKRMYGVEKAIYHLVTRRANELRIFEEDYDVIDIEQIHHIKMKPTGFSFSDGKHEYAYNYSKSTLFKRFYVPETVFTLPINIIQEPYELLLNLNDYMKQSSHLTQKEFVILPLYSTRDDEVPQRSGLNQWNANGRKRSLDEVYIPIPKKIHDDYPSFFPSRDVPFRLVTPDNRVLNAKVCQDGGKALMMSPNAALADWLLRQLLNLKVGELATMAHLQLMDCDSVMVTKNDDGSFNIDKAPWGSYERFIQGESIFE